MRVIQGDGISRLSISAILAEMEQRGLSADNIAFGMGGELLQKVNRDTLNFAMKTSAVNIAGQWRDVYKDPVTDSGKRSKKGRLAVIRSQTGELQTIRENDLGSQPNLLTPVFRNGEVLQTVCFDEVRQRARQEIS